MAQVKRHLFSRWVLILKALILQHLYCLQSKTKVIYKFSQSHGGNGDVEKVFQMLKLGKNDELALKYWQAGLSSECKEQIRNS
jgi:hypothetical protein